MKKGFLTVLVLFVMASASFGQDVSRKRIADLIAVLEKDQSKVVDLVKLTGRDFGMRPELWKRWLDKTSDKQLTQITERNRRAEELDKEWHKFALGFSGLYFGSLRNDSAAMEKAKAEWDKIRKESKEPEAWSGFATGIGILRESGDRTKAAKSFREVFEQTPLSHYANGADELATLLDRMAEEDKVWSEPKDLDKLDLQERIKYHMYHLRNVQAEQWSQPGTCHVLFPGFGIVADSKRKPNAAIELKKIGQDAIPVLIEVLDDRRPIRSVGYWRNFWPQRTILRYQDAAIQILDALLPVPFYRESSTAAYLSNESPEVRYQTITRIRDWHRACQGKPEPEKLWIAVKMKPGIHPTIKLLKALAKEHGQEKEVVKELHVMYQSLHRVYRPFIVELMTELGDESKVGEILEMLDKNEFQKYFSERFSDDSAAFLNAAEAAKRLLKKYGKGPNKPGEKK